MSRSYSLNHKGLATFSAEAVYRQSDSAGSILLFGLSARTVAERDRRAAGCRVESAG